MSKLEERENRRKSFIEAVVEEPREKEEELNEKAKETKGSAVRDKVKEDAVLVQRTYYITNDLVKAITIKTAEGELDKSGVVREALKAYLSEILETINNGK